MMIVGHAKRRLVGRKVYIRKRSVGQWLSDFFHGMSAPRIEREYFSDGSIRDTEYV